MTRKTLARSFVAMTLGATVLCGLPSLALADTSSELQSQLDQANARLDDLYSQAAAANEQVNQTQDSLDATEAEISQKQEELSDAQDQLAGRVSASYKTGGVSLVSILFNSTSFDDLVNRIYYANKVSASDAEVIRQVKDIQAELSAKQAEQAQLLSDQKAQQAELDAKVGEAQSYVSSLDQQVQDKLAEERAAYEAEQARAQQEAQQQAQAEGGYVDADSVTEPVVAPSAGNANGNSGNGGSTNTNTNGGGNASGNSNSSNSNSGNNSSNSNSGNNSSSNGSNNNSGSSSSSSGLTASQRNAIVSAAWAKVGCSYVYGATGPSSYDCSGFVQYCYAAAGFSLPRSSYSQGAWGRTTSSPQAGDIVCWGGHVGIYIGGGMMIDAGNESVGVSYRAVYGSPWYQTL